MPIGVKENVLGFEVSIGDVLDVMEVGEDDGYLGGVESDCSRGKAAGTTKVGENLATRCVIELKHGKTS